MYTEDVDQANFQGLCYHGYFQEKSEDDSTERRHVVLKHADFLMGGWGGYRS